MTTCPSVSKPAIAISGLGAVTPFGSGVNALWQALLRGDSAISDMDLFDLGGIACTRGGVIRNYTPPVGMASTPRASSFAAGACHEALAQARLLDDPAALAETALITASNFGDIDAGEPALIPPGQEGRQPAAGIHCAHASPADRLAKTFGLGGLRIALSLSCASGASAAATAANLIVAGRAQRVLIVGYDALSRFSWSGLCSLRTMTKEVVRPFDAARSGTIFSEGAAALVIERADLCAARGATALAWLRGWASGNNGHHMTAPAPRGAGSTAVMREALVCAGLPPEAVDHINTHGTGTKPNDSTETQAIQDLFGERAATIPVTSVKGLLGHMLGAAGSVELIVSVLSLQQGVIPPTGNLTTPDPECALDVVTSPRNAAFHCVLSNSAGFGGCNAAAVLTRDAPEPPCVAPAATTAAPVLITGLGVISALGIDAEENGAALQEGEPALFPLARFTVPEAAEPPLVGEAPDLDLDACGVAPKAYLDRASQLFLAACGMAFQTSGIDAAALSALNVGIMGGTAWGCQSTAELFFADFILKGPRLVKPFLFPHAYANTAVSLAAMEWALKGPHENAVTRATASGVALIEAFDLLRAGRTKVIAVCGADALSGVALNARAAAGDPAPMGEAAAALVLEHADTAKARDARPLGQLLGCGLAPTADEALQAALTQAGQTPDALHAVYVNAPARSAAARLLPGLSIEEPTLLCGDVQGATSALHLVLALLARPTKPVLVLTAEPGACVALIASCAE